MKPINFACILKLTKPQLTERAFKEGVIDQLYELLLECFHANAHSIGFPELALPALIQLKSFLKTCKVSAFTKQVKQLVDKVRENSEFISARRRAANLSLANRPEIARWERECEDAGTPLGKYYKSWRKLRDRELMHQIANRDQVVDVDSGLPEIKRPAGGQLKASQQDKQEFSALFDGDSDTEQDLALRFLPQDEKKKLKKEQEKKANKKGKKKQEEESDLDSDELEQLAGSGSDGSDFEMDDGKEEEEEEEVDTNGQEAEDGDDSEEDVEDIVEDFTMSSDED